MKVPHPHERAGQQHHHPRAISEDNNVAALLRV